MSFTMLRVLLQVLSVGGILAHPANVCFRPPYDQLRYLSDYPPALSYCAQKYPQSPCTVTKHPTGVSTRVLTTHFTAIATVVTGYSTEVVNTATEVSYVYTSTVVETVTASTSTATSYTSTSIETVYTNSRYPIVYTSTETDFSITGTETSTLAIATLPTTITTTTATTISTVKTTTTISSGTSTVTTQIDHGLRKRTVEPEPSPTQSTGPCHPRRNGYGDKKHRLFKHLQHIPHDLQKTACSCLAPRPTCKTVTAPYTSITTSYQTIKATATTDVGGLTTAGNVLTSTISTDTTTVTSVIYTTTLDLLEIDTTSIEYVSTQYTDTTTTLSTKTITITSITSYSTTNVAFTTTSLTTSTATATVPETTTTVQVANQYSLVYGPVDGCAYLPDNWISQTDSDFPSGNTHADRVAFCAQWCDHLPGCKTFGMNWFPPCNGNGDSVYCLAASESWVSGKVECGIGTGWNGCPIYRDGTIYQKI